MLALEVYLWYKYQSSVLVLQYDGIYHGMNHGVIGTAVLMTVWSDGILVRQHCRRKKRVRAAVLLHECAAGLLR